MKKIIISIVFVLFLVGCSITTKEQKFWVPTIIINNKAFTLTEVWPMTWNDAVDYCYNIDPKWTFTLPTKDDYIDAIKEVWTHYALQVNLQLDWHYRTKTINPYYSSPFYYSNNPWRWVASYFSIWFSSETSKDDSFFVRCTTPPLKNIKQTNLYKEKWELQIRNQTRTYDVISWEYWSYFVTREEAKDYCQNITPKWTFTLPTKDDYMRLIWQNDMEMWRAMRDFKPTWNYWTDTIGANWYPFEFRPNWFFVNNNKTYFITKGKSQKEYSGHLNDDTSEVRCIKK